MKYMVVIDTNVLISALLSKHDDAATVQILNAVFDGIIIPVYNTEIIDEYDNVLHRKKFKFKEPDIQLLLDTIRAYGIFATQTHTVKELPDPKDLVFYEVVMSKKDDGAYLVTGNGKHFPKEPFIVTPNELLSIINNTI